MKNAAEKIVEPVNRMYLKNKKEAEIDIVPEEVEMDEIWSFYHDKKHQNGYGGLLSTEPIHRQHLFSVQESL